MAALGLMSNLSEYALTVHVDVFRLLSPNSYFNSSKYSDVTIHFSTGSVKAHKLVLAQGSDYFRALFESSFKVRNVRVPLGGMAYADGMVLQEASASDIDLQGDDQYAVYGLIAYFYGLHFNGRDANSKERFAITCDARGVEYVKYQVDLYIVASKYLVPDLCSQVASDFVEMLDSLIMVDEYTVYVEP